MADVSRSLDENDEKILNLVYNKKTIILLNKSDLESVITKQDMEEKINKIISKSISDGKDISGKIPMIDISAKEEQGIQEFEEILKKMFIKGNLSFNDEIYITN